MKTHEIKFPAAADPNPPVVTQAMLAGYEELCRLEEVRREQRVCLIALLEDGATVEEGPLRANLGTWKRVMCSWPKLAELLPPEEIEFLQSRIGITAVPTLKVSRATETAGECPWRDRRGPLEQRRRGDDRH